VNPFDLFNPTDPAVLTGIVDPQRLLSAAAVFPGGAVVLVFALFWLPVGPGVPAGVLLARHAGINPALTFCLYFLSDLLGACICHPSFSVMRRAGGRVPLLASVGQRLMRLATLGTGISPEAMADQAPGGSRGTLPLLFRIGTVGFGVDVYTAGMLAVGLPVRNLPGWLAAIAGDLVWFTMLLATSIATAAVTNDDRITAAVMVVVMIALPPIARRFIPALRPVRPVGPVRPTPAPDSER